MPKQIKLTDRVAEMLEKQAEKDHLSLAGEVEHLLQGGDTTKELESLRGYLDKKFEELRGDLLVEGAAAGSAPKKFQGEPTWVEWEQMQYIIFELLEDDAREWRISKGAIHQLKEGSSLDDAAYTIRDGVIFIDDSPIITVSPRVQEAIDDKKVYE